MPESAMAKRHLATVDCLLKEKLNSFRYLYLALLKAIGFNFTLYSVDIIYLQYFNAHLLSPFCLLALVTGE